MDFDEFARDEFSCFRGLVLDISYRSVTFSMFSMLFFQVRAKCLLKCLADIC